MVATSRRLASFEFDFASTKLLFCILVVVVKLPNIREEDSSDALFKYLLLVIYAGLLSH